LAAKEQRINEMIRVREVRLIDEKNEQRGIVPITEALQIASEAGLDLVEVSPNVSPPVCKLLDYGKFKFEQEKRLREAKRKQKQVWKKDSRSRFRCASVDGNWPISSWAGMYSIEYRNCSATPL